MPKRYSPEIRRTALELVNQGQTQIEVAQALGVSPKTLSHWVTTTQARMPDQQRNELEELKRLLLHDSIKYPPIDNRNDPPRLSKEVLSHAKKKEDHGLRCVQQWRIKNHDQTRRKSEDPAPDTR